MSPVVRTKLGEDIRDVALDGLLCNGMLSGDLFVHVPARGQPQHIARRVESSPAAWSAGAAAASGDIPFLAGMDSSDGVQEFPLHVPLQ